LIRINCPYCYTGNDWKPGMGEEFICEDCGEVMNKNHGIREDEMIQCCPICGGNEFFYEYLFGIPIFRLRIVCYVCETIFFGFSFHKALTIEKYSHATADRVQKSDFYVNWKKRCDLIQ